MKMTLGRAAHSQRGNVLLIALISCSVIAAVLGSYLKLIQTRSLTKARTLAWNSAIPVLEAGIEEAFTHLHEDTKSLTANGWTGVQSNGQTLYRKRRDFSDASYFV